MKKVYLLPGHLHACAEPTEITTILGSCVAVALHDPDARVGGLNHYLLTAPAGEEQPSGRYASFAIPKLVEDLQHLGARKSSLLAKVYGGGNVLNNVKIGEGVGQNNVNAAIEALGAMGIPIVEKNVLGRVGRRVVLNTADFTVQHSFQNEDKAALDTSGFSALALKKEVRVVIIDDSVTARNLFKSAFERGGLKVVGTAADAFAARDLIVKERPDVVTLDIEMPGMSGVAFLEKLMKHLPVPVVMVSSLGSQGEAALRAMELGAVEFVQKPSQYDPAVLKDLGQILVEKVRAAAASTVRASTGKAEAPKRRTVSHGGGGGGGPLRLIAVGGNAGAQASLQALLAELPADTPPVVIANSTISGFLKEFVGSLEKKNRLSFQPVREGELLRMGTVYFAPPDKHVEAVESTLGISLRLVTAPPVCGQRPSSSFLFRSVAGMKSVCGVLLSGFGNDGVDGLLEMFNRGALTLVEDPEAAKFPFAPQAAIQIGAVTQVIHPAEMAAAILHHRNRSVA